MPGAQKRLYKFNRCVIEKMVYGITMPGIDPKRIVNGINNG